MSTTDNQYTYYLKKFGDYGEVSKINGPLVSVAGLPNVRSREVVHFENGAIGEVFSIHPHETDIVLISNTDVSMQEKVARSDSFASISANEDLLGTVITPTGDVISGTIDKRKKAKDLQIEVQPPGIQTRATIKKPLYTGSLFVDTLVPLGKGQKELIIGDRKTGKTSFLLTTVKSQIKQGSLVVYAAIARKQENIRQVLNFFEAENIKDSIVSVVTTPFDAPGMIHLTPYTAMTIAEYFRNQGRNVTVIMDDLSSHAKFYREISLTGKRFPGRESYPGDIFHTHARLMERAGNFKLDKLADKEDTASPKTSQNGSDDTFEASITCFPVVETVEGDLTSYISTNIMAMTDGHIFFDQDSFAKGRRPAINLSQSVTRVGRQTQTHLRQDVNQKLTHILSTYEKMNNLSHFGAELSESAQEKITLGKKFIALFRQSEKTVIPLCFQLLIIAMVHNDLIPDDAIENTKKKIVALAEDNEKLLWCQDFLKNVETFFDLQAKVEKQKSAIWEMFDVQSAKDLIPKDSMNDTTSPQKNNT